VKVKMAPAQVAALAPAPSAPGPAQVTGHDAPRQAAPAPATAAPHDAVTQEPRGDLIGEAIREHQRDLIAEAIRATTPPESAPTHAVPPAARVHSGWIIQVGASDVEREAQDRLNAVRAKMGQKFKNASPFIEAVVIGDKTLYRARFAGMEKDQAEAACRQLKRNAIPCMTIKN
jgi:D-alanyl-D-alanine carboxypeptidase